MAEKVSKEEEVEDDEAILLLFPLLLLFPSKYSPILLFPPQNILLITQDRNIPDELSITGLAQLAHQFHGSETASIPPPRLRSFCFLPS